MKIHCVLCKSENIIHEEVLDLADIRNIYKKTLGIDPCSNVGTINYYNCINCGLGFYKTNFDGSEKLYESLQRYDWYYVDDKYEYEIAKNYIGPDENVLEVGAGRAAFSRYIDKEKYYGLEFNDEAILKAKSIGIDLLKESIEKYSEHTNNYDNIVSFQVLEHIRNPRNFISACVKILRKNGLLIFAVPTEEGIMKEAVNNVLNMPPHHFTRWNHNPFEYIALEYGLKIEAIKYEKIDHNLLLFSQKTLWEKILRKIAGLKSVQLDNSFPSIVVGKISSILARVLPLSTSRIKGHTMVVVYRKK